MKKNPILWKSLKAGPRSAYDDSQWTIGEWREVPAPTQECIGFNCSENPIDAMGYVYCEVLANVEVSGKIIKGADKWTCQRMRIVRAVEWTKIDSVELAVFAAELVLPKFEELYPNDKRPRQAIDAAKAWLADQSETSAGAAEAAAWAAGSAAPTAAARAAAGAARAAAWAAWAAAGAAEAAARAAAGAAAGDAITDWIQTRFEEKTT